MGASLGALGSVNADQSDVELSMLSAAFPLNLQP
jgi:hypothetical protein